MSWIDQFVTKGSHVLDIGANIGSISEQLCRAVGDTGSVTAIEPQAGLHATISDNAPKALRLQCAISDFEGFAPLWISQESVHASLYRPNLVVDMHTSEGVPVRSLDGLRASGEIPTPITAIKIDAQGAETGIIRGAKQLLTTDRPILFIEVWPRGLEAAHSSVDELCDELGALGYVPRSRTWDEIRALTHGATPYGSDDVLFVAAPVAVKE